MSHSLVAKSHVDTEVQEFLWTIDNFDFLSANPDLLEKHVFPITIGSKIDRVSKWKLFLSQEQAAKSRSTTLFFQLVEYNDPANEKISAQLQVRLEHGNCVKFESKMSPRNFTLADDKVKVCSMSKYVRDSDRPSNPWKLDRCNENLSLEQICHKLGSNNLKLTITMKIYGKQSITVSVKDSPPPSMATEQAKHIQNQRKVMLAMLDTGLESDVTFVTRDDQRISAHKCILSMHSTVFAAMFAAEMKEKTDGVVKLVDMGGEGLKILLKFLYTGELENTWGKFYQEIVNAANKYQITQLISMCDKILPTVVSLENCVELLKFTELHGMTDATEKVKNFMKRDPQELLQLWHVAAFGSRLDHDSSSYSGPENDFYKYYARPDFVRPNYVEPDYYVRYDSADEDWD